MIGGGWRQTLGFVALVWLATSDVVDRAIPAPQRELDVRRVQAQVPGLAMAGGRPDFAATAGTLIPDPMHPLAQERLRDLGRLLARLDEIRSGAPADTRLGKLLQEVPPDPDAAVDLLGAWYDTAEAAKLADGFPPLVTMSREILAGFANRPLAERMVHPPSHAQRSRLTAALVVESILTGKHP